MILVKKKLPGEPEEIFTFPVYWGYKDIDNVISTFDKIQTKEIMLCSDCKRRIANLLLDLGIVSE